MADLFSTNSWIWVDYTIAGIVLISSIIGLVRGFIKEAFSLLTWVVAIWVGSHYNHDIASLLQNSVMNPAVRTALSFIILFIATLMLGSLINLILNKLLYKTGLNGSDRLLGLGFGVLRGVVLVAILVMLAGFTAMPEDVWWKQSKLLPPFQSLAEWLKDRIPSKMADYIKFR